MAARGNTKTAKRRFETPGAVVPPPSLTVILHPDEAIAAGAMWSLDGGFMAQ